MLIAFVFIKHRGGFIDWMESPSAIHRILKYTLTLTSNETIQWLEQIMKSCEKTQINSEEVKDPDNLQIDPVWIMDHIRELNPNYKRNKGFAFEGNQVYPKILDLFVVKP